MFSSKAYKLLATKLLRLVVHCLVIGIPVEAVGADSPLES